MTTFNLLGSLEVRLGLVAWAPRGPKVRKVLALLLLRAGQVVTVDTLIDELWDERPPRTAVMTVRTHVYHLRQLLEQAGGRAAADLLTTAPDGYLLRVTPEDVDATRFARLVREGRGQLDRGATADAAAGLRAALALWRGAPLADVRAGRVLGAHLAHLGEIRLRAQELRIEADMRLGQHRELIPELRGLVATNPLNEWLHSQLIDALSRSGRRGDALHAFQALRTLLAEELGLEPSADLRALQQEILTGHGALAS
jgi:SARP family transcriptional regulator, regulator of embCAB operon